MRRPRLWWERSAPLLRPRRLVVVSAAAPASQVSASSQGSSECYLIRPNRIVIDHGTESAFENIRTSLRKSGSDKLPYSIQILLESAVRNCDGFQITKNDVEKIIDWEKTSPKLVDIPFKPAHVLLQDFTGVLTLVNLGSLCDAVAELGGDPNKINPLAVQSNVLPDMFKSTYKVIAKGNPLWNQLSVQTSSLYLWGPNSTPYFENMTMTPPRPHSSENACCLLKLGDTVTTDHISPAGSIHKDGPAQLRNTCEHGVDRKDFDSYGSRRGNHEEMTSGTFGNIRIVNKLMKGEVGSKRIHIPTGEKLTNCTFMMLLPWPEEDAGSLGLAGHEWYTIWLPRDVTEMRPGQDVDVITDTGKSFTCKVRFDTEVELAYFDHGGILFHTSFAA